MYFLHSAETCLCTKLDTKERERCPEDIHAKFHELGVQHVGMMEVRIVEKFRLETPDATLFTFVKWNLFTFSFAVFLNK